MVLYGEPCLTRDIDIALDVGPDRWRDLLKTSRALGWQVLVQEPEQFLRQTMVLPCLDPDCGVRVDFTF